MGKSSARWTSGTSKSFAFTGLKIGGAKGGNGANGGGGGKTP